MSPATEQFNIDPNAQPTRALTCSCLEGPLRSGGECIRCGRPVHPGARINGAAVKASIPTMVGQVRSPGLLACRACGSSLAGQLEGVRQAKASNRKIYLHACRCGRRRHFERESA